MYNIRELREKKGMGQKQLAEAAGVSQPYMSDLEAGRRGAKADTLSRIAAALEVPLDALIQPREDGKTA